MGRWWCSVTIEWADVLATFPLFAGAGRRALRTLVEHACFEEHVMVVSWGAFVRLAQSDPTISLAMVRSLRLALLDKPAGAGA